MEEKKLREVQVETEDIFDGVILNVKRDQVRLPNGHRSVREVIRHVGAVCVVPVTEDGKVVIERQYRYPIDQVITEIPAGKLDSREEDRLHAAKRELMEETGITADSWTDMGLYYGAPAYSDEKITMYLAQNLHMGKQHLDEDEFLNVEFVPLEDLVNEVLTGEITDGKTQAAILKAAMLLRRQNTGEN
ncbi:MAG: NUDIX hydrolase [Oscillospiraceae bacterium]|nr:NUDIX hydrolase [Oscillospiraceae bacterium]